MVDHGEELVHPLAGEGGDENDGRVGHIGQAVAHVRPHLVHGLVVLFDAVPLVDHDDAGFARLVSQTRHLGVLLRDPFVGVDEDEAHVTTVDGHGGTEDGELLHSVVYLGFFAHTGRVDEDILAELIFKVAVHCVPGGAGHVADDDPLLPQDAVDQGGLAHVGLADDRHLDDVLLLLVLYVVGEILETGVQHLVHPQAVDGGDGDGVAQTQVVELVHVRVGGAHPVGLVHRQHHRLLGAQEHIGHVLVGGGDAGADVAHQDDDVGVVNGDLRLAAHEL